MPTSGVSAPSRASLKHRPELESGKQTATENGRFQHDEAARELYMPGRVPVVEVLGCLLLLSAVKVSLATVGFRKTIRVVEAMTQLKSHKQAVDSDIIDHISQAVTMAGALYPGRALCLQQAIALYGRLRWWGLHVTIRLGVQPHPFDAHAWVEHLGSPIHEDREKLKRFALLPELPR